MTGGEILKVIEERGGAVDKNPLKNEIVKTVRCAEQLKARALYSIEGGSGIDWAEASSGDYTVSVGEERSAVGVVPDGAAAAMAVVDEAVEERLKKGDLL
ncbi:uncharacterized protein MONOS_11479 [Monocercomonoides exilis]|uniref:uncharacterized protein n=1 Tax=Monocercomonoides exilis TaxID=2049356 RepID=UPI00355AB6D9|nr:hypothetical protein MONOS_11479 [Monocercomonoides exilis]|eukprot:MONOS_11479.1-p1 / transcript=MONOS_11479.1 / gene=MONOS_11479 / organism=Monocercomonoides_exilis_PA203 / gene_product=unspecified product / transcript_product=unspecified product / location=Mono_scaffold00579:2568-3155(+) / protein_length=100 / sequence_SO=supercontig / SO=protein_coding / is_pseudo=false